MGEWRRMTDCSACGSILGQIDGHLRYGCDGYRDGYSQFPCTCECHIVEESQDSEVRDV